MQTLIALVACYFASWSLYVGNINVNAGIYFLIFSYLGIAIAAHAFPETPIGKLLWNRSVQEVREFNLFGLLAFPYVILIYIVRILHIFWIDILYEIVMIFAIKFLYFDKFL